MSDMRKLLESLDSLSQPMEDETSSNLGISQGSDQYDSSIDFESDVSDIAEHLRAIMLILGSSEWNDWMKQTDINYGSNARRINQQFTTEVQKSQVTFDQLYDHLVEQE
jgi:hypothetical protein